MFSAEAIRFMRFSFNIPAKAYATGAIGVPRNVGWRTGFVLGCSA
jgi:hypothetical protein